VRVAIVGGGFAGVGAAIGLREAGIEDFVLLERADELGGTWRDNTYPGCACDVPSALYSYSFAPNPDWSRVFARQEEIQDYLLDTAERHHVPEHVQLGAELLEAAWDGDRSRWVLETTAGRLDAHVLLVGAGPLHEPVIPDLPGLEDFEGKVFHSSRWDHDHDLGGERVAVVGTGASAVQFVPRIQPRVEQLHVFQRTAAWVLPKLNTEIPETWRTVFRRLPFVQRAWRALLWAGMELVTAAAHHRWAVRPGEWYGLRYLRRSIPDPDMRRALTPHFALGCKRVLLANGFYRALRQPNVELVPAAVQEVRARAVVGADGRERTVDTIIFGTGFHVTDLPIAERVRGRTGRSLAEEWQGSPQAYLGTAVTGFPNAFLLFGPNIGVVSAFAIIEAQVRYVVDALRTMEREGTASVEVRPDVQAAFNERVQDALEGTVWNAGGCASYYLDANGRNSTVWPWSVVGLQRRLRRFDLDAYRAERGQRIRQPAA
jgi:cyclohexanone monooxygenase